MAITLKLPQSRDGIQAEGWREYVCFAEVHPGHQVTRALEKWAQSEGISCNYPDPHSLQPTQQLHQRRGLA